MAVRFRGSHFFKDIQRFMYFTVLMSRISAIGLSPMFSRTYGILSITLPRPVFHSAML